MVDHVRLLEVLVGFARTLVRSYDLHDVLATLSSDVAGLLEVDGAGVMLEDAGGTLRFVAASDEHIGEVERLQSETREGPCVRAHTTGRPIVIDDLTGSDAFPDFTRLALAAGIRAVYSFPMRVDDIRVGALNLYRTTAGDLDDEAATIAQLVGDLATSYIVSVDATDRASRLADQLQSALETRVVIEQAKGMLSQAWGTDVTSAFERLRRYARSNQQRLHDVAGQVLDGRLDPGDIDPMSDRRAPAR